MGPNILVILISRIFCRIILIRPTLRYVILYPILSSCALDEKTTKIKKEEKIMKTFYLVCRTVCLSSRDKK